jgi:NTE family protein
MKAIPLKPGPRPASTTRSPRLALVLGSGGVRSAAAIGVAEELALAGLAPDVVVGCSSGALFGATIAMGMRPADALAAAVRTWRPELTGQRRQRAWLQLALPRLAGFDEGFALRDDSLIARAVEGAFGDTRFEDLPTRLRVAATDAATGAGVVLEQGLVSLAVRASMALPFIFPSVPVDGRPLMDGAIADPLPVSAAADADVVIALSFPGDMPRRVDRASRLVARVSTALINNLMQARLEAARAAGQHVVLIELALQRRVGLWETEALPAVYEAGRQATRLRLQQIRSLLQLAPQRRAA